MTKTKIKFMQIGGIEEAKNGKEIEYEVVETNNARWLCGDRIDRETLIRKCRCDQYDIKIVPDGYPSSITLTI